MGDALEATATAADSRDREEDGAGYTAPFLFVAMHCDAPLLGGARYGLADCDQVVIGRAGSRTATREVTADGRVLSVRFPGTCVSRVHARLLRVQSSWVLVDHDSRNGTFVNGVKISRATLADGDVFECGRTLFIFRAARAARPGRDVDRDGASFGPLSTLVPELELAHERLLAVAPTRLPVLLLGESGAGKEIVANAIHERSGRTRGGGAFVAMNCAAIPPGLLESQLFGHVKGAFSGAVRDELGYFRAADQGTLFLDELGDLPSGSQAAFLRALEEGSVVPVGTTRPLPVDTRIVAATNRPLDLLVAKEEFRQDLLARLQGYTHRLLPLRERIEDLGSIVAVLLGKIAGGAADQVSFTPEAALRLLSHTWPLNIRELRHALAAALVVGGGAPIGVPHIAPSLASLGGDSRPLSERSPQSVGDPDLRTKLTEALTTHRGNVSAVARTFGKAPVQIYRWLKQLDLDPDRFR